MAEDLTGDDAAADRPRPTSDRRALEAVTERTDLAPPRDLPFEALNAPEPLPSAPPSQARWLGFAAILLGGLLGAVIGWGTGDVLGGSDLWAAVGALAGAVFCAAGVGVVATLTLRAMNEWNAVHHPEADEPQGIIADRSTSPDA